MVTREYVSAALKAVHAVRKAVLDGELPNLKVEEVTCSNCHKVRATQYDHRDYSKPLDVTPVCASCNGKLGKAKFDPKKVSKLSKNDKICSVRIDKAQYERLVDLAKKKGVMISWLLCQVLDTGLEKEIEWMDHLEAYKKKKKELQP